MNRCSRCHQHPVPVTERLCSDCRFVYEIGLASAVLIVIGALLIALVGAIQ